MALYDTIGVGYRDRRRTDPRIASAIEEALGEAKSVLDVGSGTGSYQPRRRVLAVEPSTTMIRQRPPGSAPVLRARAEELPITSGSFDAGLAVLTIHHWSDAARGLSELARVSRRQVVLTWDPHVFAGLWLIADYLPEIATQEEGLATLAAVGETLRVTRTIPVPIPADCTDGFCGAYWKRPNAYLDAGVRRSISAFAACDQSRVTRAMERLGADLDTGRWAERYRSLMSADELDLGYRLVVCDGLLRSGPTDGLLRSGPTDGSMG